MKDLLVGIWEFFLIVLSVGFAFIALCLAAEGVMRLAPWLWSLTVPKRYREDWWYYWEQWKDTDRWEGGICWTFRVFEEYAYPGYTYSDEEREIQEQYRTEDQRKWRKELDTFGLHIGG